MKIDNRQIKIIKRIAIVCGILVSLYVLLTIVPIVVGNIQRNLQLTKYSVAIEVVQTLLERLASEDKSSLRDLTYQSKSADSLLFKLSVLRKAVTTGSVELGVPAPGKAKYPPRDMVMLTAYYADTIYYDDTTNTTLAGTPVVSRGKSTEYCFYIAHVGEEWKIFWGSPM